MTELQECIDKLTSEDEADRIYAAEDIGYANRPEGVPPLLARLPEERSRAVRESLFAALAQIEDDSVIEGSIALLDSEDPFLRNQAVEILRARGEKTVPHLDRAFRDGGNDRRKFVIDVLAKLGKDEGGEIYDLALRDRDINVVITAVESLGATRKKSFRERVENLLSREAHPMLLCACVDALAQIGEASSVHSVRNVLGGSAELPGYLHPAYLKLLGAQGCAEEVSEVSILAGRDGLAAPALNALTSLRTRHGATPLPDSLAQPLQQFATASQSPLIAYQAVRLMAALLHKEEVFDFVCSCLVHSEKAIRIAAFQVMRESGSARAEAVLREKLAKETDAEVLQALTQQP